MLALLGVHHFLHVSRIRVKEGHLVAPRLYFGVLLCRCRRSTGELSQCNILRPNSAPMPPSKWDFWTVGLWKKMWQYPAGWREAGPGCQTLKFSLRLTDAKAKKKGRKYKVMLFASRPRERGMGFVDDTEQLCSVRIIGYIMHKTLNFTGIGSCLS